MSEPSTPAQTPFDEMGGMPFFDRLVAAFYRGVATDEVLAPLYPEAPDFAPAAERLTLFLAQYWGGPTTYSERRGHPKLRMRHFPFHIGPGERDRWLAHMTTAVRETAPDEATAKRLLDYFIPAADHLRNDTGLPITRTG